MSRNFCRGFRIIIGNGGISLRNSSTLLGFPPTHLVFTDRLFSRYVNQERPFVVSYLINSCGLSAESAKSVSKRIDFETPNGPDWVLSLLKKDYGFTISHISNLVKKKPQFLLADPIKILLPKLNFLSSIGVSSSDLPEMVCCNPNLLTRSLHDYLIPTYNMLKIALGSEKEVIQSLRSSLFANCLHEKAPSNIALLRKFKVSQQHISFLLTNAPDVLCIDAIKFSGNVNKVIEMGIGPSNKVFACALQVISKIHHKAWEQKMGAYRSWGLSEEEILSAFRKHPYCMSKSVKKITGTMDFIVNKMGYKPADAICCPLIFSYSLEKRIIPRFSVIRVLQLEGLVKANMPIYTVITTPEKNFLNTYMIKYEGKIPQLSSVYQGKMSIQELGYDFEAEKHVS